ncbi:hypothetical protein BB934_45720 (plasmid) [Microvirga ossetica]|uniref:Uncharacterized protein n=1 Tax=Microvirga ossetica TaxID=1882682 RepID=A0A1B2EZU7_9HYPH|nr:hypothetical protein [Microvirga ossetica]ANY85520.1 hypothetical protein BB934_45720 [Microvirga ossetica]
MTNRITPPLFRSHRGIGSPKLTPGQLVGCQHPGGLPMEAVAYGTGETEDGRNVRFWVVHERHEDGKQVLVGPMTTYTDQEANAEMAEASRVLDAMAHNRKHFTPARRLH